MTTKTDDSTPSVDERAYPRQACANCRFYRLPDCRRNAPQATFAATTQSRRAVFELTWPHTLTTDWCGEWEAIEPV